MILLAFGAPGPSEWMLILVIVLVLFGAKKLPELARGLGQSMNEFRKAREEFDHELQHTAGAVKLQPPPSTYATGETPQPVIVAVPVQPQHPSPVDAPAGHADRPASS